jgi:hypothetical protein
MLSWLVPQPSAMVRNKADFKYLMVFLTQRPMSTEHTKAPNTNSENTKIKLENLPYKQKD